MPNKKVYFVIGGCLVVYFVVMFIFLVVPKIKKDNERAVIIFDTNPSSFLLYSNAKWENGNDFSNYNWKKFDIYVGNQVNPDYIVQQYKEKWYFYKNEKEPVHVSNMKMGIYDNIGVEVLSYKEDTLSSGDLKAIQNIINQNGIYNIGELGTNQKVIVDIDSDGVEEEILVASNYYLTEENKKTFSLLILRDGNDINIIEEKYFFSNMDHCSLHLDGIIQVKGKNHMIAGCTYFDRIGTKHCMYQINKGKYERLVSC